MFNTIQFAGNLMCYINQFHFSIKGISDQFTFLYFTF